MELYIGGYAQGKKAYVQNRLNGQPAEVVWELHHWVREMIARGEDAESTVMAYIEAHPDCVIICDEIGNGIVPMDEMEREYRERLGRLLIRIAQQADRVERVICGLGQRLK